MTGKKDAGIEDFSRQVVMLILHIMRNFRHSGLGMMTDVEVSYSQILVMYALLETGQATMSELSRWLKISHGVATRMVDRLVEKGMVERKRDEADRRVVLVSLSKEGRGFAEKMISVHLDRMDSVFESVGKEKSESFLELLAQINDLLEE
jgi:DNA-binding MarR family transcriptional regulator